MVVSTRASRRQQHQQHQQQQQLSSVTGVTVLNPLQRFSTPHGDDGAQQQQQQQQQQLQNLQQPQQLQQTTPRPSRPGHRGPVRSPSRSPTIGLLRKRDLAAAMLAPDFDDFELTGGSRPAVRGVAAASVVSEAEARKKLARASRGGRWGSHRTAAAALLSAGLCGLRYYGFVRSALPLTDGALLLSAGFWGLRTAVLFPSLGLEEIPHLAAGLDCAWPVVFGAAHLSVLVGLGAYMHSGVCAVAATAAACPSGRRRGLGEAGGGGGDEQQWAAIAGAAVALAYVCIPAVCLDCEAAAGGPRLLQKAPPARVVAVLAAGCFVAGGAHAIAIFRAGGRWAYPFLTVAEQGLWARQGGKGRQSRNMT
eukprot:SAG22_NODE_2556_length_2451_cov_1.704932_3_plen_365_part_00